MSPAPPDLEDQAPFLERAFTIEVVEGIADLAVEGALPAFVSGTAYWNGPGRFERFGQQYRHWLDGDGMVCALRLTGARPRVTNRFVRSEKFVQEEAAGRRLFRQFGTSFDGDRLKRGVGLESPANVSVYPFAGALLAFGEQGLPWAIDPQTLATRSLYTFGGQLNDVTPFSAHPKCDTATGEMFNFGVAFGTSGATLHLFRFSRGGALEYRRRVPLPYAASIHDFAISATYAVFYVSPLVLDIALLLRGGATLMDALRWEPARGSALLIVRRDTGEPVVTVPAGDKYCLHLANAFESPSGLVVDLIECDRPVYDQYQVIPALFTEVAPGALVRVTVDVEGGAIVDHRRLPYTLAPDFPTHDVALTALPCDDYWMLGIGATGRPGRKFLNQLVRCDWSCDGVEVYEAPRGQYLGGEPLFLPDPSTPREGVVICPIFDAERVQSSFGVFDARRVSRGPIATLASPHPIPLLFHSSHLPD